MLTIIPVAKKKKLPAKKKIKMRANGLKNFERQEWSGVRCRVNKYISRDIRKRPGQKKVKTNKARFFFFPNQTFAFVNLIRK